MKTIDQEIREIEGRMARRRHEVADTARAAKDRATRKMLSPAGLAIAAGLGFVATTILMRRKPAPVVQVAPGKAGKVASLVGVLMPVVVALMRAQFGTPAGMAQFVLSRMQRRESPSGDVTAPAKEARLAVPPVTRARTSPVHPAR